MTVFLVLFYWTDDIINPRDRLKYIFYPSDPNQQLNLLRKLHFIRSDFWVFLPQFVFKWGITWCNLWMFIVDKNKCTAMKVTRFHILQAISLLLKFFTLFSWCFVFSFFYIIKNYQISTTYMWHAKVDDAEKSHHAIRCVKKRTS